MDNHFLSIDWGTSNLRIKLVKTPSLEVVWDVESTEGVKHVFDAWKKHGGSREDYFLHFLHDKLQKLAGPVPGPCQIVISGMSSSSIGLRELPYADLPFSRNGEGLYVEQLSGTAILPNPILLVSGVKTSGEVMRGEEVQMLGLINEDESNGATVFILPGTHSKHVVYSNGQVSSFKTYMTGEIFQVLTTYSILSGSVSQGDRGPGEVQAFDEGVLKSQEGNSLLNVLFGVRTSGLFKTRSGTENYYYLSGLLIGDELRSLVSQKEIRLKLCAGGRLLDLYHQAMMKLKLLDQTEIVEKKWMDASVIKGQWQLLKHKKPAK